MVAQVVPALALPRTMGVFDYAVPRGTTVVPGARVEVPFRRRRISGVVWGISEAPSIDPTRLRTLSAVAPTQPVLNESHRAFLAWVAARYAVSLGHVVKTALQFSAPLGAGTASPDRAPLRRLGLPLEPGGRTLVVHDRQVDRDGLLEQLTSLSRESAVAIVVPERTRLEQIARRLPTETVLVHGSLTARQRREVASRLQGAHLILGTRVLLLAPLPPLALLVLDDEESAQHKARDQQPRYTSQRLATRIAADRGLPVLALSPAPSLSTFECARRARRLVHVRASRPTVQLVSPGRRRSRAPLQRMIITHLENALATGERTFIFLNRRGQAQLLACPECSWIARCNHCRTTLTQHAAALECPTCGRSQPIPTRCSTCGNVQLRPGLPGTAGLERTINERFPNQVARLDRDARTTTERAILIGTELALPRLARFAPQRAIILGIDAVISKPNARAIERGFQLLRRIAATDSLRSVLIETRDPGHSVFQRFIDGDVEGFLDEEWRHRRELGLPPATPTIVFEARRAGHGAVTELKTWLSGHGVGGDELRGPIEAFIGRRRVIRFQLSGTVEGRFPEGALTSLPESWIIDPDPLA